MSVHAVMLSSAGFKPALVKSRTVKGVSLMLTKHFKHAGGEMSQTWVFVCFFAVLKVILYDYRTDSCLREEFEVKMSASFPPTINIEMFPE